MLLAEEVCWSRRGACPSWHREDFWSPPQVAAKQDGFHLWLPQVYLPGFLRLSLELGGAQGQGYLTAPVKLEVVAHYKGYYSRRLASLDLPAGGNPALDLALPVPTGPVRLEVILKSPQGGWPVVERLGISPDLAAEYRWRWGLLKQHLQGLPEEPLKGLGIVSVVGKPTAGGHTPGQGPAVTPKILK
jgi:hypothetical protein